MTSDGADGVRGRCARALSRTWNRLGLNRAEPILLDPKVAAGAVLLAAAIAAVQEYLLGPKVFAGVAYTHYNNFRIFERSFRHLLAGQDLYARYPAEYWDLFKYSPTFAALMAPFSLMPEWAGLVVWNLLNAGALAFALTRLSVLPERSRALVCWFLLPDALTAFQHLQANVLLAGLIVLAYVSLEEDRPGRAALFIVGAAYVKIYPVVAAVLALLYPRKRRFVLWAAVWLVVLAAVPLLCVSPDQLVAQYRSWARLLGSDASELTGLSVVRILHSWFHLDPPREAVALVGAAIWLLPLLRIRLHADPRFRLSFLGSLLMWVVIFNHMAESATFVIAVVGVALAYFAGPRRPLDQILLGLVFVLTSMSPRFPRSWVVNVLEPYAIKAVPCVLFWAATVWHLLARVNRAAIEPVAVSSASRPFRRASQNHAFRE
jgi:hypothetical protein